MDRYGQYQQLTREDQHQQSVYMQGDQQNCMNGMLIEFGGDRRKQHGGEKVNAVLPGKIPPPTGFGNMSSEEVNVTSDKDVVSSFCRSTSGDYQQHQPDADSHGARQYVNVLSADGSAQKTFDLYRQHSFQQGTGHKKRVNFAETPSQTNG
jgi:hypothetical protein